MTFECSLKEGGDGFERACLPDTQVVTSKGSANLVKGVLSTFLFITTTPNTEFITHENHPLLALSGFQNVVLKIWLAKNTTRACGMQCSEMMTP